MSEKVSPPLPAPDWIEAIVEFRRQGLVDIQDGDKITLTPKGILEATARVMTLSKADMTLFLLLAQHLSDRGQVSQPNTLQIDLYPN